MSKQTFSKGRTRPLEKCVDVKHIRDWTTEEARRRIEIPAAWMIIKRHYCAALIGRGVCPITCETCREAISSMFGFEGAANPEALLTWRAKDRSAVMIETLIEKQKRAEEFPTVETSADPLAALFPHMRNENLFLAMENDYQ